MWRDLFNQYLIWLVTCERLRKQCNTSPEIMQYAILPFFGSEGPFQSLYPGRVLPKDPRSRMSEKPALILLRNLGNEIGKWKGLNGPWAQGRDASPEQRWACCR